MSDCIIETHHLSYCYGSAPILQDIDLQVPHGCIYGFLGPNGAGKTTAIRLLLGLLRQDKDNIRLFGTSLRKERVAILKQTGSLVEEPSFYGHLSARENLRIIALLRRVPVNRVDEVLRIMQLQKDARHKVKTFSIGMKQRLALAMVLLSAPPLLVLDEPTNGLDPQGIADIREFLRTINKKNGVTIFLSSHLLSEVEKLADMVGVLFGGQLLFQGSMNDLKTRRSSRSALQIETNDVSQAIRVLSPFFQVVKTDESTLQAACPSPAQAAEIARLLVRHNLDIYRITPQAYSLEAFFLSLIPSENKDL